MTKTEQQREETVVELLMLYTEMTPAERQEKLADTKNAYLEIKAQGMPEDDPRMVSLRQIIELVEDFINELD